VKCRRKLNSLFVEQKELMATITIGVLGFDSRRGLVISVFKTAFRTALGPTQPPIQWVPGALSLGVKQPGREADHSPPSSAEDKECVELYVYSSNTHSLSGARLKHRDNFTFYGYIYRIYINIDIRIHRAVAYMNVKQHE
jgi:hypothetical protein